MLTKERAEKIKAAYNLDPKKGYRTVAKEFGVSWKVVFNIVKRGTYRKTPAERFWEKVDVGSADECWTWKASINRLGYGSIGWNRKVVEAHRVSFFLANGIWPGEKHVLHSCDNRACVNPSHLRLGTHRENMKDMSVRSRADKHSKRLLTIEQAREIRAKRESGVTLRGLAKEYGVSKSVIDGIVYGWRYKESGL